MSPQKELFGELVTEAEAHQGKKRRNAKAHEGAKPRKRKTTSLKMEGNHGGSNWRGVCHLSYYFSSSSFFFKIGFLSSDSHRKPFSWPKYCGGEKRASKGDSQNLPGSSFHSPESAPWCKYHLGHETLYVLTSIIFNPCSYLQVVRFICMTTNDYAE